jgi:hypothetical protein
MAQDEGAKISPPERIIWDVGRISEYIN